MDARQHLEMACAWLEDVHDLENETPYSNVYQSKQVQFIEGILHEVCHHVTLPNFRKATKHRSWAVSLRIGLLTYEDADENERMTLAVEKLLLLKLGLFQELVWPSLLRQTWENFWESTVRLPPKGSTLVGEIDERLQDPRVLVYLRRVERILEVAHARTG